MHKFGPTTTLDKLDHGKDALGLTCTACHGGNPAATEKDAAHVRPRSPCEWMRDGKFRIPDSSGQLLDKESIEFVRYIIPGDLCISEKSIGAIDCINSTSHGISKIMS